jgi:hypothetical protein
VPQRKQINVYAKEAIRLEALAQLEAEARGNSRMQMPSFFEITVKRLESVLPPKPGPVIMPY